MEKHFRKGLLVGFGLASLAANDARKRVNAMIQEGEITKQHGEKLLHDVTHLSAKQQKEIQRKAEVEAHKQLKAMRTEAKVHLGTLRRLIVRLEKEL
ncbi:MAG: hypothetical protein V1735_02795 [Nanoarchaeota archaeon]